MLHTPIYDVRSRPFCGPTAIAAVTGEPISIIRDIIRDKRGPKSNGTARAIMGVGNTELIDAMDQLGWKVAESVTTDNSDFSRRDAFKLSDFFDAHGKSGPFIVNVTGHYIAVSHGEACDTATKLPIDIRRWKKARTGRWVQKWWRFELKS